MKIIIAVTLLVLLAGCEDMGGMEGWHHGDDYSQVNPQHPDQLSGITPASMQQSVVNHS